MPLATSEAYDLINSAEYKELDGIFTTNIPGKYRKHTDRTDCLITEVDSIPDDYSNNEFHSLDNTIEVQIFYKKDMDYEPEIFELELMRLFQRKYWHIDQTKPHVFDPDTNQITKTFYFSKIKYL